MQADPAFLPPWGAIVALAALSALLAAALLSARHGQRARRRAEAELHLLSAELAAQTRHLHLCAQEMHGLGLRLLGQGGGSPPATTPEGSGRALLCLAADLQDAAAQAAGPRKLREERVVLGPLLKAALEQVALALVPGRREWRIAPELPELEILADRRALRGALAQVLTRAVRHTREGDAIELRLVRADETFAILVEDEGAGLGAEDLGPALGGEGTRGLGLGLAVARQLLRAHGGDLTIEALRGVGARTWMTLPRGRLRGHLPGDRALSAGS